LKITVKQNLIVFHKPKEWDLLQQQLIDEHGMSVILIRNRCRRELGFTVRHHKGLVPYMERYGDESLWLSKEAFNGNEVDRKRQMAYENQVHLDFYNEAQQTFFVLKYLNN
jgi:hypothetical protein